MPARIMLIRHAEKPDADVGGVDLRGQPYSTDLAVAG
jgi:hypothetical protein